MDLGIERSTKLKIKKNSYEVNFPTVGELIQIESLKITLSNGKYGDMLQSNMVSMLRALDYIDMIAYFSTLCPNILKDAKVDLTKIDAIDAIELLSVYKDQFIPFWKKYENLAQGNFEEEEVEPETVKAKSKKISKV